MNKKIPSLVNIPDYFTSKYQYTASSTSEVSTDKVKLEAAMDAVKNAILMNQFSSTNAHTKKPLTIDDLIAADAASLGTRLDIDANLIQQLAKEMRSLQNKLADVIDTIESDDNLRDLYNQVKFTKNITK